MFAIAYINRGYAYYNNGQYNKALDDINKAKSLGCQVNAEFLEELRKAVNSNHDSSQLTINEANMKGAMVQIQNTSTIPTYIMPGNELKLEVSYHVLNSDPEAKVNVKEKRVVTYNGQQMFKPLEREVERDQGLLTSTAKMNIPKDAQKGEYEATTTLTYGDKSVASVTKFTVS